MQRIIGWSFVSEIFERLFPSGVQPSAAAHGGDEEASGPTNIDGVTYDQDGNIIDD